MEGKVVKGGNQAGGIARERRHSHRERKSEKGGKLSKGESSQRAEVGEYEKGSAVFSIFLWCCC